jgi:uncharacterized membrane protein YjjP (DUF1212 family)
MEDTKKILHASTLAGVALLKSGAEIFRVQETMSRIIEHYGVKNYNVYVIANGIFANIDENRESRRTAIRDVPLSGIHLGLIDRINSISREMCQDSYGIDEAIERLEKCQTPPPTRHLLQAAACGVGAAAFGILFGAGFIEAIITFFLGMVLQFFLDWTHEISKFLLYIAGAFIVTAGAAAMEAIKPAIDFNVIVIGAIMPMFPGVGFTTSIRELFNGDHVSGSIHLTDALMTSVCVAVGVGTAIGISNALGGVL